MRIVSGKYGGREVAAPRSNKTRPITDKDREALFNILGDIEDLRILDAYAGSGVLGLEALSRGASFVDAIEVAKGPGQTIVQNVKNLEVKDSYKLYHEKVRHWAANNQHMVGQYNIVLADPPFDEFDSEAINNLGPYVASGGMLVLKHSAKETAPTVESLNLLESRAYGDTILSFYRKA